MILALQNRRLLAVAAGIGLAFGGLGYRLVDLQVIQHAELADQSSEDTQRTFVFEPRRGDIHDIRGHLLATSVAVKTVCANPTLIRNSLGNCQTDVARALAPLLSVSESEIFQRLQLRLKTNELGRLMVNAKNQPLTNRYVVLKRKVPIEQWLQITQAMTTLSTQAMLRAVAQSGDRKLTRAERSFYLYLGQSAISAEDDQLRVYPNQSLAAHVLGHVAMTQRKVDGRTTLQNIGKDGVERTLNEALTGAPGWRRTETDSRGRELVANREQDVAPRAGLNATLTLDARIQDIVEAELAEAVKKHSPVSASAIVVQPRTGAVLAMATLPNYNPNQPGLAPIEALRNRVVADEQEPGSTFKIVVVTAALNEGIVTLNNTFDCEQGHFVFGGRVLGDHDRYGNLTVEQIIAKSSNIGAAKVGIQLGAEHLYAYMRAFGFGDRTDIYLPGERIGTVHPLNKWDKLSISRIPMGQGVTATPLQITMAMSALANGGCLMRPMLIDRLEDDRGRIVTKCQPQMVRRICSEQTARQMVTALKSVVNTNGTATKARLDHYYVAGKTGTAQKSDGVHYLPDKYFSSFIGFFPADQPELCIAVFLDEPPKKQGYYGGQIVAPVFHAMAERIANYLGIRPDILPGDALVANHTAVQLTSEPTD